MHLQILKKQFVNNVAINLRVIILHLNIVNIYRFMNFSLLILQSTA